MDNPIVQRILQAAEDVAYYATDNRGEDRGVVIARRYSSTDDRSDYYTTDDHTTTNSGSDYCYPPQPPISTVTGQPATHQHHHPITTARLAEAETAFSDDCTTTTGGVTSSTDSPHGPPPPVIVNTTSSLPQVRLEVPVALSLERTPERAQFPAESPDDEDVSVGVEEDGEEEECVVYREHEGDNSCVDMDDEDEETGESRTSGLARLEDHYHTADSSREYIDRGGTV